MRKLLFFDCREIESIRGFDRVLEPAVKSRRNPLFLADRPWENGNFTLYGSVVKAPGKPFQLWYSVIQKPWNMFLCYAESEDGIQWTRPLFDIVKHKGRKTNIVLGDNVHGPAVICDIADPNPNRRYKLSAGLTPSDCIHICHSPDGIHWTRATRFPVIGTNPDCPMAFLRMNNGRYAVHHRVFGLGRRVCRSESWDLTNWSEPRMVMEPDAGDPPQVQFYGMGATPYGDYELGTLWMFHTDPDEPGFGKMKGYQETELAYARSGFAWHRLAQGTPFIPHGRKGQWDRGCLQCASQPVFLDDEIRFYYAGTDALHCSHWELLKQTAGLGLASIRPDGFVALKASIARAELTTLAFPLPSADVRVNARIEPAGSCQVELLDQSFQPIPGAVSAPMRGDSTGHAAAWKDPAAVEKLTGYKVRLRVRARQASLYSVYSTDPGETPVYWRFTSLRP